MQLPIDTTNLTLLAGRIEPVIDFETRQPRADANGELIYGVDVVAFGSDAPQIWPVKVSGQPRGVSVGQHVKITGLMATPWSREGRSGVAFRAAAEGRGLMHVIGAPCLPGVSRRPIGGPGVL
jgi:hypothetical protein